jgi:hypothetical protein
MAAVATALRISCHTKRGEVMRNIRLAMILCATAIVGAFQTPAVAAAGSNAGRVHTLLWYQGHVGLLVRQDGMSDLGGCGRGDYFILDDQHAYFKEIYALLLSAHVTDQPISIHVDGCVQGISRIMHVSSVR